MAKILSKAFIVLVATLVFAGCQPTINKVSLINDSTSVIQKVTIEVSGQSFSFQNISPSEKRDFTFRVRSDSDYSVKTVFVGGRELNKNQLGYVTSGINSHDEIRVKDADITLENIGQNFH